MEKKRKNMIGFCMIVVLLILGSVFAFAAEQDQSQNSTIYLHIGSPLILSQGEIGSLDPQNPDVAATVVNGRTLVPLRALSEYFGAEVSFHKNPSEAIISYGGTDYAFPVNGKKYVISSVTGQKEIQIDSETLIMNGRTMVPVRVICEDVLGKKVSYDDHVIAVSDQPIDLKTERKLREEVKSKIGEALKARSVSELRLALNNLNPEETVINFADNRKSLDYGTDAQDSAESAAGASSETPKGDYTRTLTQVEGIDEADIVKTDGKEIYISADNAVHIVGTEQGKMSNDATLIVGNGKSVDELYVDGNRLVLIGTRSEYGEGPIDPPNVIRPFAGETAKGFLPPYYHSKTFSFVDVYDVTDPKKPVFLKEHEMEGAYLTSRKNGDIVYLVTNTIVYRDNPLPLMKDSVTETDGVPVKLDDVMIMPGCPSFGYIILSAVDIRNESETEVEAITAYGSIVYMSDHALYLAENAFDQTVITKITKFNINGMKIGYAGSGKVEGALLNQFSMDEYQGFLRVAATQREKGNGVYILDGSLNVVGSVEGLAKGETIYSVRFIGETGYVVTFRNMDPLFVFDLSDPKSPKLTGELTIPGFSNYLQPVGENMILGIGADTYNIYRKDRDGKDVVIGTRQGGIKLSLFDVSDLGKPKEISKYVLGDSGSYTEAFYNHKAVMLDNGKNLVAFDASICSEKGSNAAQALVLIDYGDNKLTLKGTLEAVQAEYYGRYTPYAKRGVAIGNEIYYIQNGRVTSYDYESLSPVDTVLLN